MDAGKRGLWNRLSNAWERAKAGVGGARGGEIHPVLPLALLLLGRSTLDLLLDVLHLLSDGGRLLHILRHHLLLRLGDVLVLRGSRHGHHLKREPGASSGRAAPPRGGDAKKKEF